MLPSSEGANARADKNDCCYGFGFQRSDVFGKLLEEYQEILDIKNPGEAMFFKDMDSF